MQGTFETLWNAQLIFESPCRVSTSFSPGKSSNVLETRQIFILTSVAFPRSSFDFTLDRDYEVVDCITGRLQSFTHSCHFTKTLLRAQMQIFSLQQAEFNLQPWCVDSPS